MSFYLSLPLIFLKFWYFEAPGALFSFFGSLNRAFLHLFSLPLLIKTFFKPWKNEYREGLVGFSIGMGMFIKTFAIAADLVILLSLLAIEVGIFVLFLLWPPMAILWIMS